MKWAKKHKLPEVRVMRGDELLVFNPKQYELRAPAGPYRSELVAALELWLQKHALDKLRSQLQTIFAKHPGWRLLFTPPYTPIFQPIELLWRHSKSAVASDWFEGRKLLEVYECLIRSWYGGNKMCSGCVPYSAVSDKHCKSWIFECEDHMDAYIKLESKRLEGTILDLTVAAQDTYDDEGEQYYEDMEEDSCEESLDDPKS